MRLVEALVSMGSDVNEKTNPLPVETNAMFPTAFWADFTFSGESFNTYHIILSIFLLTA